MLRMVNYMDLENYTLVELRQLAKEKGIKTVSLGKRILRAETASVVATTLVQLKTGGLL